jgi:elongation factor G
MVFINKMDRPGADFERALQTIRDRFGDEPVPVGIPVIDDKVVLHAIEQKAYSFSGDKGEEVTVRDLTEAEAEELAPWREQLLLSLAEHDEPLAEKVLMEEEVSEEEAWAVLRRLTQAGVVRPAFSGSALRNWGVQPLLDAMVKLMPSPLERAQVMGTDAEGNEVVVEMVDDEPLVALVFKVQLFDGRRHCFVRLYRGTLEPGEKVRIAGTDNVERAARVFDVSANRKTRVKGAKAGQIVLLAGLRDASTGDTLCHPDHPVLLERIDAREPVLGLAIEPMKSSDEDKLNEALTKVTEEDPTLVYEDDEETGQKVLSGMGELHLMITFERLKREFGLDLRVGKPRVVHRETIQSSAKVTSGVDRVIEAGSTNLVLKATCTVHVEPLERGTGIEVDTSEASWVPNDFEPTAELRTAVDQGARDALSGGPVEGSPLQDIRVRISRVDTHDGAANAQSLRIAAATAVREALQEAGGQLMQPIMKIEVVVPDENTGSVLGDLQARGASILGHEPGEMSTISAECGLSQLLGYATALRSSTKGRGQFVMEFDRFDVL